MLSGTNPGIWFEISVTDMARAIKFYEAAFAIKLGPPTDMNGVNLSFFPMEAGGRGIGGALIKCPPITGSHLGTTIYFSVKSVDAAIESIKKAGGDICLPKKDIGQYGFIAQFKDTEGNRVGIHQMLSPM